MFEINLACAKYPPRANSCNTETTKWRSDRRSPTFYMLSFLTVASSPSVWKILQVFLKEKKNAEGKSLPQQLLRSVKKKKKLTTAFLTWTHGGAEQVRMFEHLSMPLSYWSRSKSSALLHFYSHGHSAFIYLDCNLTYWRHWETIINNTVLTYQHFNASACTNAYTHSVSWQMSGKVWMCI